MRLVMLGTGNALATRCYNTCFILEEGERYFLVDAGGGNGILSRLKEAKIDWKQIRDLFVTHSHLDHITGILWLIRRICQNMNRGSYEGEARIFGHEQVLSHLSAISHMLLGEKESRFLGQRLFLVPVDDGQQKELIGHKTIFFDIGSTKQRQFGFSMELERGGKLTCLGDEPFHSCEEPYARNSKWLLSEAFCLDSQAERFKPYEKHHTTVKEACIAAERLGVENLILYHTEDENIENRKALYLEEGSRFFSGNLYVPEDLESFDL